MRAWRLHADRSPAGRVEILCRKEARTRRWYVRVVNALVNLVSGRRRSALGRRIYQAKVVQATQTAFNRG